MIEFPPKRIVVPMDLSEVSFLALGQASELAEKFGAILEILHVKPLPSMDASPYYWNEPRDGRSREQVASEVRSRSGTNAPIRFAEGDPAAAILYTVYAKPIGMIVMGSHGKTGLRRALLGSVAEAVIRRSPVPVLVIRREPAAIGSVLAPVNFTDYSNQGFFYAAKLAAFLQARLTALHVPSDYRHVSKQMSEMDYLMSKLPEETRKACRPQIEVLEGSVEKVILERAREMDLVVLAVHKQGNIRDFVFGSTAERILRQCHGPLLAVPPAELEAEAEKERRAKEFHMVG